MRLTYRIMAAGVAATTACAASAQMNIVISPNATLASNAPALAAFQRAANDWSSLFSDPITVTINAGMASLGSGIIGSTSSFQLASSYDTIRNQMVADASDEGASNAIVSSLPTAAQFTAFVASGSSLSGNVVGTKANLKAMGFTGLDATFGASDAQMTFSTNFSFDFDSSDGVGASQVDFESVAAHEIGHALGFISGAGSTGSISPTALDLFRFRTSSPPVNAGQFTSASRDLTTADDSFSDTVNNWRMSTGADGFQTSHWKADDFTGTYIGIMDPSLANGVVEHITPADLRAFDLIGYDLAPVPEPATLTALGLGALVLLRRRRK